MTPLPDDVRAILDGRIFAHLATTRDDGAPHTVPVWIGVDGDTLVMFTQRTSRKARNIARDARVAISAVAEDNPYSQCDVRGRVVAVIEGDDAQAVADDLARKYTGEPFPWRSPDTIAFRIAPERARHVELPFTHGS